MNDLTSSNNFYRETQPSAIGEQPAEENGSLDRARDPGPGPGQPAAPAPNYSTYADAGDFAPVTELPADPAFQPQGPPEGPPAVSWPLIAAGVFVLWLIFRPEEGN